jgi:hypothetical protein
MDHTRRTHEPLAHIIPKALAEYLRVSHHTLYQVSTATALVEGIYQGAVRVGTLREHGDLGLGTFEDLDGEMVVVDGRFFQVRSDGSVRECGDDVLSPFAVVTRFASDATVTLDHCPDMSQLTARFDGYVAAGIAAVPEASESTSIKERVDHVKAQGRAEDLKAAQTGSVAGSVASAGLEESHWLCPIEDRRGLDSSREGMLEGLSLGNYVLLVDYTGRLFRDGKAAISREVAGILERLGTTAETWQARLEKLRKGRFFGRFFAASRQRLREVADRLGLRRVPNAGRWPAT